MTPSSASSSRTRCTAPTPTCPKASWPELRAAVVNSRALAEVGRGLDLGSFIRLGRVREGTGGRDKASILADTLEAVIGAVYLDQGLDAASELVHRLFDPLIEKSSNLGAGLDWKTSLQELTATEGLGVPEYLVTETGPDHEKTFTAAARVGGVSYGTGTGRSKKEAEQQAAESAWRSIRAAADERAKVTGGRSGGPARRRSSGPSRAPTPRRPLPDPSDPSDSFARSERPPPLKGRAFGSSTGPPEGMPCPSCPRSRSCGAAWSAGSPTAPSPTPRCCTRARYAGTSPAPTTSPTASRATASARPAAGAEYLWLPLEDTGQAILAHLGMSGQLLVQPHEAPVEKHLRIRVRFTDTLSTELRFVDQRTFGGLSLHDTTPDGLPDVIAHIARDPPRPALRRRGLPPRAAPQAHHDQTGPARPVTDQRRRQHLRRRGSLALPPALRTPPPRPSPAPAPPNSSATSAT